MKIMKIMKMQGFHAWLLIASPARGSSPPRRLAASSHRANYDMIPSSARYHSRLIIE